MSLVLSLALGAAAWGGLVAGAAGTSAGSGAGAPPSHVGSYSLSEVHVRRNAVQIQLRCQVLSLGEVIEPFDPDLDGSLEPGELVAHEDAIIAYVAEHYRLVPGAQTAADASDPMRALKLKSATVSDAPLALDPLAEVSEWIDVVLDYEVTGEFTSLGGYFDLFYDTSPQHRDSSAVVWNGIELGAWQYSAGSEANVFVPDAEMLARSEAAWRRYFRAGARRSLGAFDALLLTLLFVAAARARSRGSAALSAALFALLIVVGAVGAPMADLLPQHVRFLELTVPLALAYVGVDDLLHGRGRTRVLETTVFGLVLGAREATRLAPELAREASATEPLAGFGLGLATSLMGFAAAAMIALRAGVVAPSRVGAEGKVAGGEAAEEPAGAFTWRPLRVALDFAAVALGLYLFWSAYRS